MGKELAVQEGTTSLALQEAKRRYNLILEYTRSMMVEGKDYGVIPGTDKPTLLKPGAEKLTSLFELVPDFIIIDKILDFAGGLFYFQYQCSLTHKGELVASGIGSCNSKEKKYRYRYIPEWKATDDEKSSAIRKEKKTSRNNKEYTMLVIENTEPFELVNTIDKMAQKRALIAATLIAANASEFFTQDIEDLQIIEGEYIETMPEPETDHSFTEFDYPEHLETIVNSKGVRYVDIPTDTLSHMYNGIKAASNKPDLPADKQDEYSVKSQAIQEILKLRNGG